MNTDQTFLCPIGNEIEAASTPELHRLLTHTIVKNVTTYGGRLTYRIQEILAELEKRYESLETDQRAAEAHVSALVEAYAALNEASLINDG